MKNELIANDEKYTNEKIALIKNTVAKDANNIELQLFIEQCKRTGLDPITRQIYFMKGSDGRVQIQTSIDGFRLVAERSGAYEGQTPAMWCGEDGVWKDVWLSKELPMAARVGVWKKNFREPLYAIALFDEYAQKKKDGSLTFMWNKMPALMIAKVAESLALRKAFPNDLSGLYTQEEMAQSEPEKSFEEPQNEVKPQNRAPIVIGPPAGTEAKFIKENKARIDKNSFVTTMPAETPGPHGVCTFCGANRNLSAKGDFLYCPNFKDPVNGKKHPTVPFVQKPLTAKNNMPMFEDDVP